MRCSTNASRSCAPAEAAPCEAARGRYDVAMFLDLERWPRRAAFDHFRRLGWPYFALCASVDVTALRARVAAMNGATGATLFLGYHHAALAAANAVEPFRYRLAGAARDRVRVLERLDGSTTVLREDESIAFANLPWEPDFAAFVARALPLIAAARSPAPTLGADDDAERFIHMTAIPWLSFTSFSHARALDGADSVPKLAFGRIARDADGRETMPVAVEVHHALMDGLHVGRFFAELQRALDV